MGFDNPCDDSSSTTQENNDTTSGTERPLKKARFAWQVKGKYHLKTKDIPPLTNNVPSKVLERNQVVKNLNECDAIAAGSSGGRSSDIVNCDKFDVSKSNNSKKRSVGELRLTKRFMESTLPDEKAFSSLYSNKNIVLSKARCSTNHLNNSFTADKKIKTPIPVSMVKRKSRKDAMLAKWQAKQIATAFVDNTINGVLDSWVAAPLSSSGRLEQDVDFCAEEFLDTLPRRCSVENEGILMAISRHGLRNNCVEAASTWLRNESGSSTSFSEAECLSSRTSSSPHTVVNRVTGSNNNTSICSPNHRDVFFRKNTGSDTEIKKNGFSKSDNNALCSNSEKSEPKAWRDLAEPCVCSHSVRTGFAVNEVRPVIPFHKRVRAPVEAEHITDIETNLLYIKTAAQNSSSLPSNKIKTVKSQVTNERNSAYDQSDEFGGVDFMDVALACAIKDKGLNSFGLD